jgi:hypothetical protein
MENSALRCTEFLHRLTIIRWESYPLAAIIDRALRMRDASDSYARLSRRSEPCPPDSKSYKQRQSPKAKRATKQSHLTCYIKKNSLYKTPLSGLSKSRSLIRSLQKCMYSNTKEAKKERLYKPVSI